MKTWTDRVYSKVCIHHAGVEALIQTPTMQRLGGVMQSGPSALVFPFKTVSRLEHSLGVYLLLERLGADLKECVAGLLHDISHTAFSHAIDFLITSEEQNHHEQIKGLFLHRDDIVNALARLEFQPQDFEDDSKFTLLEQPLPALCADRIDYFLRDGLACGELGKPFVSAFLSHLVVVNDRIAISDLTIAETAAYHFQRMNRHWWASESEAFIYNKFADVLQKAIDSGVIRQEDLLGSDEQVMDQMQSSGHPELVGALQKIRSFCPSDLSGFVPRVIPKHRWIDPPVWNHGELLPLSVMQKTESN